ncbi:MAG: hypothetical protein IJ548_06970 [Paludibacteraceae bacterium]|nr:hypothetical protein [Paludibacteraceae bacterium]MBQ8713946.1 hypothetical protein [Prevotella sp.]
MEISSPIIAFADANVKNICVANWDTNGDGVVNVTDIVSVVNIILSDPVAARELLGDDEDE